nr:reverse transcriptase [Tanacetum cinerariifolium]
MRADRFWKKTGKKITIQGSDVASFDKSKVKCFNCHKMGHFTRECRSPRSQDRGKRERESYKKDPKEDEASKKHALVADEEEVPIEYALMAKSSSSSDNEEIYVMQPPGFQDPEFPHSVYKVEKAMYGLHQAPNAWYGTLSKYLLDNGFQREHNTNFHQIVDFFEAFYIRVETIDGETKILAKVNGRQRTVSESSIRRHLKINDEEDETAFPIGDVRYEEAFLTENSLDAGQYPTKTSNIDRYSYQPAKATLTYGGNGSESRPGNYLVEDRDKSTDKWSDSTDEMSHVLGTLGAANILASGGLRSIFTTASLSVPNASTCVSLTVATASGSFPTVAIFTTASVATPTTKVTRSSRGVVIGSSSLISINIPSFSKKEKGKGKMTEPE